MSKIPESRKIYRPMLPIGVSLKCDKCDGEMQVLDPNTSRNAASDVLKQVGMYIHEYEHVCNNPDCGNTAFLTEIFPRIEYDDLENYLESSG